MDTSHSDYAFSDTVPFLLFNVKKAALFQTYNFNQTTQLGEAVCTQNTQS